MDYNGSSSGEGSSVVKVGRPDEYRAVDVSPFVASLSKGVPEPEPIEDLIRRAEAIVGKGDDPATGSPMIPHKPRRRPATTNSPAEYAWKLPEAAEDFSTDSRMFDSFSFSHQGSRASGGSPNGHDSPLPHRAFRRSPSPRPRNGIPKGFSSLEKNTKAALAAWPPATTPELERLRSAVYGTGHIFDTPFGRRTLVYADYAASGRLLEPVDSWLAADVYPTFANVHSEVGHCAQRTGELLEGLFSHMCIAVLWTAKPVTSREWLVLAA
jgi:hypothetical protein